MLKRLRSGWLWVMTGARLVGDLSGLRVFAAGYRLAQKVGAAALLFLFFFQNAGLLVALLIAGVAFVAVHTYYEFRAKNLVPDVPELDREFRERLHDFNQAHRDLADISKRAGDGERSGGRTPDG